MMVMLMISTISTMMYVLRMVLGACIEPGDGTAHDFDVLHTKLQFSPLKIKITYSHRTFGNLENRED